MPWACNLKDGRAGTQQLEVVVDSDGTVMTAPEDAEDSAGAAEHTDPLDLLEAGKNNGDDDDEDDEDAGGEGEEVPSDDADDEEDEDNAALMDVQSSRRRRR